MPASRWCAGPSPGASAKSLGSTAQYTLHGSANAGPLLLLRRRFKAAPETAGISIGDLVVFCAIQALLEVPDLNAELIDDTLHRHQDVAHGLRLRHTAGAGGPGGPEQPDPLTPRPLGADQRAGRPGRGGDDRPTT